MVSADIHSMETPSPLPTPGYLPLLSEASTPLTPATLQGTPLSISPGPANSPRISFRSFTLPLDLDESCNSIDDTKLHNVSASSEKLSRDPSHRLSCNLDNRYNVSNDSRERIETYDINASAIDIDASCNALKCIQQYNTIIRTSDSQDQEMTCDVTSGCCKIMDDKSRKSNRDDDKSLCQSGESTCDGRIKDLTIDVSGNSRNDESMAGTSAMRMPSSSNTDLDSPMSCEQTLEDLPDSGFVICDSSEKMFTNTDTQALATNTNDSGEWVMIERTTESVTTPTSDASSPKDPLEGTVNPAIATDPPRLRSTSDNVSRTSLDLTMGSNVDTDTSCIGTSDLTESPILVQESADMVFDIEAKECKSPANVESNVNAERKYGSDRRNGNERPDRPGLLETDLDCALMEQESYGSYRLDNANVYRGNLNDTHSDQHVSIEQENLNAASTMNQSGEQQQLQRSHYIPNSTDKRSDNQQRFEQSHESHHHGFSQSPRKTHHHHHHHYHHKYLPKQIQENVKRNNIQNSQICDNQEVVIASENAAEPCEIAHAPEGASEATSLDSSCTFSNASSPIDDSVVLRDTAAILQELALQRLSGGASNETALNTRRRYDSEVTGSERRSFDSEIGREIVRERKMKQELETARGKSEEPPNNGMQYLPPCLRARHARATRAALSRSLDEGKFNRMAGEASLPSKQTSEDSQHNSTPNVGTELSLSSSNSSDKLQSRNLGGLDLDDPRCRERIEKYKEERRMFLRDKYRSESFRGTTSRTEDDGEQALLARLKQRASRPSLH